MLPEITPEELSAVLDEVARDVLEQSGVEAPPVEPLLVAQSLGIRVVLDDRQPTRARCVRLQGIRGRPARSTILVRPEPRPERRNWAVAHEIGEQLAWRVFAALSIDARVAAPRARETVANYLAGRLLVPGEWLAADAAECDWDLPVLKRRYATASHELIARRMLDMRPPVIITIVDEGQVYLRASNVPGLAPPLQPAEARCQQAVHRTGQPHRLAANELGTVHGWPVHEEGWKREILRTVVDMLN